MDGHGGRFVLNQFDQLVSEYNLAGGDRHILADNEMTRALLSAGCGPDMALGDVPLFYPFVVNDPGEGAQAKRRAHGVVVDHLLPPMTRADTYDETARLEQLFDEYAQLGSLDPSKLPAIRERIWATITAVS